MSPPPIPRGSRSDAQTADRIYLFKRVATLRATYQVRLLAFLARERGQRLVLKVPPGCRFEADLAGLIEAPDSPIDREDLP